MVRCMVDVIVAFVLLKTVLVVFLTPYFLLFGVMLILVPVCRLGIVTFMTMRVCRA